MNLVVKSTLVFFFGLILVVYGADYCRPELCPVLVKHTACNNNGAFAPECSTGTILVNMTRFKSLILNKHNDIRNKTATGLLPNHSPAVRMASMSWDIELEYIASLNSKRCVVNYDECRNTDTAPYSGQNVIGWWAPEAVTSVQITDMIDYWIDKSRYTNMTIINSYYEHPLRLEYWTQMIAESNKKLGCSITQSPATSGGYSFVMTCNYATTNFVGARVYESGPTASKCTTGRHFYWTGLCSVKEVYPV